ncbi:MAG: Ig-like domain-containing protein [Oligoflexia bacterium]|nr:Ig-like domain-containing protein [Oligoflexia bacterium]
MTRKINLLLPLLLISSLFFLPSCVQKNGGNSPSNTNSNSISKNNSSTRYNFPDSSNLNNIELSNTNANINTTPIPKINQNIPIIPTIPVSATNSTIVSSSSTLLSNGKDTATITVSLKDSKNNLLNSQKTVILSSNRGTTDIITNNSSVGGIISFTVKSTTAGTANFQATVIDNINGNENVILNNQVPIKFIDLPATNNNSAISISKNKIMANQTDFAQITVTAINEINKPIANKTVSISVSSTGDSVSIFPTNSSLTNQNGAAIFNIKSSTIGKTSFNATITATINNDTSNSASSFQKSISVTFLNEPVNLVISKTLSTITSSSSSIIADGLEFSTITVTLKDQNGAVVPGQQISILSSINSDTITSLSNVTNEKGDATFTIKSKTIGSRTISATASSNTTPTVSLANTLNLTFTIDITGPICLDSPPYQIGSGETCYLSNSDYQLLEQNKLLTRPKPYYLPSTGNTNAGTIKTSLEAKKAKEAKQNEQRMLWIKASNIGTDAMAISKFMEKNPEKAKELRKKLINNDNIDNSIHRIKDRRGKTKSRVLLGKRFMLKAIRNSIEFSTSIKHNRRIYLSLRLILEKDIPNSELIISDQDLENLSLEEIKSLIEKTSHAVATEIQLYSDGYYSPLSFTSSSSTETQTQTQTQTETQTETQTQTQTQTQIELEGVSCDFSSTGQVPETFVCNSTNYQENVGAGKGWDWSTDNINHQDSSNTSIIEHCNFPLKPKLTCIKDQSNRGTCVIFSMVAAIETMLFKKINVRANLSEQDVNYKIKNEWYPENEDGYSVSYLASDLTTKTNYNYFIPFEYQWNYNPATCLSGSSFINACKNCDPGYNRNGFASYYPEYCSNNASEGQHVCISGTTPDNINQANNCGYRSYVKNRNIGVKLLGQMNIPIDPSKPDSAISTMISYLNNGFPVSIAVQLNTTINNAKISGVVPDPLPEDKSAGGHAMLAVAFIPCNLLVNSGFSRCLPSVVNDLTNPNRGIFVIKNSWGTSFGDYGFLYISDLYFRNYGWEYVAITDVSYSPPTQ